MPSSRCSPSSAGRSMGRELEGIVGWPPDRISSAFTELSLRGLAIDDGGATRLAHDLIRNVVVGRIPDATRRQWHGRIATALEAQSSGDVGVMLAALEHRVAAGRFDADLALRILTSPQRRLIEPNGVRSITDSARKGVDRGTRTRVDAAAAALAAELGDQDLALERWAAVAEATSDRVAGGARGVRRSARGISPRARRGGATLARCLPGQGRRRSGSGDLGGWARGTDTPVARSSDERGAGDGAARCAARPHCRGHGRSDRCGTSGLHGCRERGMGGGHPGRGLRRHRRAGRGVPRRVKGHGAARGARCAGDDRHGARVLGGPVGSSRHLSRGLGRGLAGGPPDRGDRCRVPPGGGPVRHAAARRGGSGGLRC